MVREASDDADEQRVIDDIREYGWHVVGVEADEDGPAFAYSVGIQQTLNHPEIIVFGLNDPETMMYIINTVGDEIRKGASFEDWHESDEILNGYSCVFRWVSTESYPDYLGYAKWYYQPEGFDALQCIWPDKQHRYPWHPECHPSFKQRQPILADDTDWPFHEGMNRAAITIGSVLDRSKPILLVTHSIDGDWQFLSGEAFDPEDGKIVSLHEILKLDETIASIADLPAGWQAEREGVNSPWQRSEIT